VNTRATYQNREITQEEQRLYDHLLNLVQAETPQQLVDRCRSLFIQGTAYPEPQIQASLDRIVNGTAEEEFRFVLNRCCHILINRWQTRPNCHSAIVELVDLFEASPTRPVNDYSRARTVKQLRSLVQQFVGTEQHLILKRLAQVVAVPTSPSPDPQPLGTLIRRYPYLYEHCLVSETTPEEQQASVKLLQTRNQRQFELDLSQYATFQVRRSQSDRAIHPVKNPTLLTDRALSYALHHFAGKVYGSETCKDVAQRFLTHSQRVRNFGEFKSDLYHYVTASVAPEYGKRQFNKLLSEQLKRILPESDAQPLNDFLMVRTCSQLLNFLVVESSQQPQHYLFVDLLSNLGPTLTTRLLLSIVLLCGRVKPYLEKRFSILFNHYETYTSDRVHWLIAAMENLHLAFSTNFSSVNLCFIR
jgi:hypothetical protein